MARELEICLALQVVKGQKMMEGAGVRICRTLGTGALKNLDPFLMLVSPGVINEAQGVCLLGSKECEGQAGGLVCSI